MESEKRNPKEFWSFVNDLMEKQKADPSADVESSIWTNYFKSLMNIDCPSNLNDRVLYDHDSYGSLDNSILNMDIYAEADISAFVKAVKSLKSGKSCGISEISNEPCKCQFQYCQNTLNFCSTLFCRMAHSLQTGKKM